MTTSNQADSHWVCSYRNKSDIINYDSYGQIPPVEIQRSNKGYKYLLAVIDVFSNYGWIVPLKTKTGKEVALTFRKLFLVNTPPSRFWMDKGDGFYNQQLKAIFALPRTKRNRALLNDGKGR